MLKTITRQSNGMRLLKKKPKVEIYSKPDCCLCDDAKAMLNAVKEDIDFDPDIDQTRDPRLETSFCICRLTSFEKVLYSLQKYADCCSLQYIFNKEVKHGVRMEVQSTALLR